MKRRIGIYIVAWAVLLALFNVISFVSVGWIGQEKYTPSFWIGYTFISIMFVGQLICAIFAFKADSAKKIFYKITLIKSSYAGLIASFIVGGLCMIISSLAYWIGIIVCAIVLTVNILSVTKAVAAVTEVERIDEKVKTQTFFINSLTVDANTLVASAGTNEIKTECKKVYEAIRYSDPVSNDELASIEVEINIAFANLSKAVKTNDADAVTTAAKEIIVLIDNRNNKCKLLK